MTEQLRCDNCGKTTPEAYVPQGWRRVEHLARYAVTQEDDSDKHFCSTECIEQFYAARVVTR